MDNVVSDDVSLVVYKVIKYGIIFGIAVSSIILIAGSVLVHDTAYIKKNPKFFISETLIMGILTTIPIIYLVYLRGGHKPNTIKSIVLFFMKIALIHVGFQLSGVYTVLFGDTT